MLLCWVALWLSGNCVLALFVSFDFAFHYFVRLTGRLAVLVILDGCVWCCLCVGVVVIFCTVCAAIVMSGDDDP